MSLQPIPVHRSDFWDLTVTEREGVIERWYSARRTYQPEREIAAAYRDASCQEWLQRTTREWKLIDIPLTELSENVGISTSQASRWINKSSVSLGVLNLYAGLTRQVFPRPDLIEAAIHGLPSALAKTTLLDHLLKTRVNRTPAPPVESVSLMGLAVTLFRSPFVEAWHRLTSRYANDLRAAENDSNFLIFLNRFSGEVERLTQTFPSGLPWKFPRTTSGIRLDHAWHLCQQLNRLWTSYHRLWPIMWHRIGPFTPWSTEDDVSGSVDCEP